MIVCLFSSVSYAMEGPVYWKWLPTQTMTWPRYSKRSITTSPYSVALYCHLMQTAPETASYVTWSNTDGPTHSWGTHLSKLHKHFCWVPFHKSENRPLNKLKEVSILGFSRRGCKLFKWPYDLNMLKSNIFANCWTGGDLALGHLLVKKEGCHTVWARGMGLLFWVIL